MSLERIKDEIARGYKKVEGKIDKNDVDEAKKIYAICKNELNF